MSRSKIITGVQVFLLAVLLTGCGQKADDTIDFGTFNKSVYTNVYFGLSVTIPPDWSIQDQALRQRMLNLGGKLISGDDKNLKAIMSASEPQTVTFFAVSKYPLGSAVESNPTINAVAVDVRPWPGIKTGKDYLFLAKKLLEDGQIQFSFPKAVYTEQLGGVDFDVMEAEVSMGRSVIKERFYTTIKKGFALSFVVTFKTVEDEASLQKIFEGMTFK